MPHTFERLDAHRIRIKHLANELEQWPCAKLVEELCREAETACLLSTSCARWFFAVLAAGRELLSEGGWRAWQALPEAIAGLDDAMTLGRLCANATRADLWD